MEATMSRNDENHTAEPEAQDPDRVVADAVAAERAEVNRLTLSSVALGALDVVAIAALGPGAGGRHPRARACRRGKSGRPYRRAARLWVGSFSQWCREPMRPIGRL